MASDDPSGGRPAAPIVLRIKLRYDDLEVMVQRFAANVGKSGLFLPTRSMQPIGAEVKFELRLADDTPALVGLGRVKAVKPPDPHNPRAAFGMAVELMRVTPQSRALILRMLERRRELELPEVSLPTAADIDAARRAEPGDAAGRDLVTGPVPVVTSPVVAAPPAPAPPAAPVGEGLLTAPRRTTGPSAAAKVTAIAPLPPELPRRPRAAVSEVIERASGPVVGLAAVPGLDDNVDIAGAIARARALAGGALDAELEALSGVAAAPLETSVEAASAELARQLGGSAVRRDRSAGWAPRPATSSEPPGDAGSTNGVAVPANGAAPAAAPMAEDAAPMAEDAAPVAEDAAPVVDAEPEGDSVPSAAAPAEAGDARGIEAPDDEDDAGVHARPFGPPHAERIRTEPSAPVAVLYEGEDRDALALAALAADERTEMGDIPVATGGFELPANPDELAANDPELAGSFAPPAEAALELGVDEFDDFEIIAEADADDADLLASHGEHDTPGRRDLPARPQAGERRPSELDFAARLDLGDDSELHLGAAADEFSARHVIDSLQDELTGQHPAAPREQLGAALPDPHAVSAGAALAAFDTGDDAFGDAEVTDDPDAYAQRVQPIFDPDSSSSFTLAGIPSDSIDIDLPTPRRAEPVAPPRSVRRHAPLSLHEAPVGDDELEHALEALDVDLDDLSIAAAQLPRDRSRPTPTVRSPAASRTSAPGVRVPAAAPARVPAPTPAAPARVSRPTPAAPARAPHPTPAARVAAPTPSRAVRPTGLGAPGSGRIAAPRAPSEGIDIDFDDDD